MLTKKQVLKLLKNQEYWAGRLEEIVEEVQRNSGIQEIYRQAYSEMESEIIELHKEIVKKGGKVTRTQLYKTKRYKALMDQIKESSIEISEKVNKAIFESLENAYKEAFSELAVIVAARKFTIVDKKQANTIINTKFYGEHFSDRVWANTRDIAKRIKNDVISACVKGTGRDTLVKNIMNDFDVAYYKADRIVRTETMRVANQSSLQKYKEFGAKKVKWITSSNACDICKKLNGKLFDIDTVQPIAHPNCKCTQIPVIEED